MTDTAASDTALATSRKRQRGRMFAVLGGVVAVGAIAYGGYHFLVGANYVATDNAYAGASVALITPQYGGSILTVPVHETQVVKAGDVLVILEAMKMENEIVAPQDGTVASINVNKGDTVNSGDVLVSMN